MGTLTSYALVMAIFLALGWLAARFASSRANIITVYIISLVAYPMICLTAGLFSAEIAPIPILDMPVEMETMEFAPEESPSWPNILIGIYLAGASLALLYTLLRYITLFWMIIKGNHTKCDGYTLVEVSKNVVPFSWGKYIVISQHESERSMILLHEQAHLRRRHYLDLLLAQAVNILQWFNPATYALYNNLRSIQEYEADRGVVASGVDVRQYQLLLLRRSVGARYPLVNSFDNTNLKKRIYMMNKKAKSNGWQRLRALVLVPAVAVAFGLSNTPAVASILSQTSAAETMAAEPATVIKSEDNSTAQPHFPGGGGAMMQWLAQNMKYPQRMVDAEIQGKEIVGFTVQPDGRVTNFKILQSVCPEADAEVMRLLSEMPLWEPGMEDGKPIACQYALPVTFKLSGLASDKGNSIRIISYGSIKKDDTGIVIQNKDNKPSIFVDGKRYEGDFNSINPETIQSVKVQKGLPDYPNGRVDIILKK